MDTWSMWCRYKRVTDEWNSSSDLSHLDVPMIIAQSQGVDIEQQQQLNATT